MTKIITQVTKVIERIASNNMFLYHTIAYYYKNMIKREVELANISDSDNVLCIGGGGCPFSSILIHEYTGASVTIIDNDYLCVLCAQNVVNHLGYGNSITVLHANGKHVCTKGYSVIHLAVQVSPLTQVFRRLEKRCKSGVRVLVRLPKKRLSKLYCTGDNSLFKKYNKKVVHSCISNVQSTSLYITTGGENEKITNALGERFPHNIVAAI